MNSNRPLLSWLLCKRNTNEYLHSGFSRSFKARDYKRQSSWQHLNVECVSKGVESRKETQQLLWTAERLWSNIFLLMIRTGYYFLTTLKMQTLKTQKIQNNNITSFCESDSQWRGHNQWLRWEIFPLLLENSWRPGFSYTWTQHRHLSRGSLATFAAQ